MKKLYFLIVTFVYSVILSIQIEAQTNVWSLIEWPEVTEKTEDAAYEASSSKLYGTWIGSIYGGTQKWIFNSNGTFETQEPSYDVGGVEGIKVLKVIKGSWSKKGNNLKLKINKNVDFIIAPESQKQYNSLSARKKDIVNKNIKGRTENTTFINDEYLIKYINTDYLIIKSQFFRYATSENTTKWLIKFSKYQQVIKETEAKEAKEKTEKLAAQKKAEEERQQKLAEENKRKEIEQNNNILGFLPLNLQEKVEKGELTVADAAKGIHSLTIPPTKTSFPQYGYDYFTELDTLIAPSTVHSVSKGNKPLSLLVLNSINTNFTEGIAKYIIIDGIDFPNAEDLSYYKVVVPFQYKDWKTGDPYMKKVKAMTTPFILKITDTARPNGLDNLKNLRGVFINSVKGGEIYPAAFSNCSNLKVVNISQGTEIIGGSAFYQCYSLTNIILPTSLRVIDSGAFYECYSLTNIYLPEGLEIIGEKSFFNTGLAAVTLPSTMTKLYKYAFANCDELRLVSINGSYDEIYKETFENCPNLVAVSITASIKKIGKEAFSKAKAVYFGCGTPPKIDKSSFGAECIAYVPSSMLDVYQKSYKKIFSQIIGVDDIESAKLKLNEEILKTM